MTSEAAAAAKLLGARHVMPRYFEGWAHFAQGRASLNQGVRGGGTQRSPVSLSPGERVVLE